MIKEILTIENEENWMTLGDRADEIDIRKENNLMREIIVNLKATIRDKNLAYLTAPQIGYNKRIFCINFNGDIKSYINPAIIGWEGLTFNREQCNSIPNKEYIRPRNTKITIIFFDPLGKVLTQQVVGMSAFVFQHAVDHLDGLLLSDIGLEIEKDFDEASEEERDEIIKMYMDSLDIQEKEINKEIENNEVLKKTKDAIDFMGKVQRGEVKLGAPITVSEKEFKENGSTLVGLKNNNDKDNTLEELDKDENKSE